MAVESTHRTPARGPMASAMLDAAKDEAAQTAALAAAALEAAVTDAERGGAPVAAAVATTAAERAAHAKTARRHVKELAESAAQGGADAGPALMEIATLVSAFGPGVRGPSRDVERAVIAALGTDGADVEAAVECLRVLPLALAEGRGPFAERLGTALAEFGAWVAGGGAVDATAGFEPPLAAFGSHTGLAPQPYVRTLAVARALEHVLRDAEPGTTLSVEPMVRAVAAAAESPTPESGIGRVLLPLVQAAALDVLDALVARVGPHLGAWPGAEQAARAIVLGTVEQRRPGCEAVRASAYRVLERLGAGTDGEGTRLAAAALRDARVAVPCGSVADQVSFRPAKVCVRLHQAATAAAAAAEFVELDGERLEAPSDKAAPLRALEALLYGGKMLGRGAIDQFLCVAAARMRQYGAAVCVPDAKVRGAIFDMAAAALVSPLAHASAAAPAILQGVFQLGLHDANATVAASCRRALALTMAQAHPRSVAVVTSVRKERSDEALASLTSSAVLGDQWSVPAVAVKVDSVPEAQSNGDGAAQVAAALAEQAEFASARKDEAAAAASVAAAPAASTAAPAYASSSDDDDMEMPTLSNTLPSAV